MNTINQFFAQGGYGFFIWGAYGMVAIILCAEIISLYTQWRTLQSRLMRLHRKHEL